MLDQIAMGALAGACGGGFRAIFGKWKKGEDEGWNSSKFIKTVIFTAVLGAIWGAGAGTDAYQTFLFAGFSDVILEDAVKGLLKH